MTNDEARLLEAENDRLRQEVTRLQTQVDRLQRSNARLYADWVEADRWASLYLGLLESECIPVPDELPEEVRP